MLDGSGTTEEGDGATTPPRHAADGATPTLTAGVATVALAKRGVVEHSKGVDERATQSNIASGGAKRKGGDPRGQRVLGNWSHHDTL